MKSNKVTKKVKESEARAYNSIISCVGMLFGFIFLGVSDLPVKIGTIGITNILNILRDHLLGNLSVKEEETLTKVLLLAKDKIKSKLDKNYIMNIKLIKDNVLTEEGEEFLQGFLLKVKNEYQKKKLEIESSFFANIFFEHEINQYEYNHLLGLVNELSYRKLCLLSIFGSPDKTLWDKNIDIIGDFEDIEDSSYYLLSSEFYELLEIKRLIQSDKYFARYNASTPRVYKAKISDIKLTRLGELLYRLSDLNKIKENELDDSVNFLRLSSFLHYG